MRTTTVVRTSFDTLYLDLDLDRIIQSVAFNDHLTKTNAILESFKAAHGITTDNLVSQSEGDQRVTVRSWPDLATAQAWVDLVLSGALEEGLSYPPKILSAQVDPE
jgi:hypothetical protein